MFSPQLRAEPAPPIVNAALTRAAAQDRLKVAGVAALGLCRQRVLRGSEFFLKELRPIRRLEGRRVFPPHLDRFAEAHEDFRQPFLPEDVFDNKRHKQSVLHARRQVTQSRLKMDRALAHVGEAALRGDCKQVPRRLQDGFGGAQKLNCSATGALLHAEEAQPPKHFVAFQHRGINRREGGAVGKEFVLEHEADQRVPPGSVVRVDDQRQLRGRRQARARDPQGVEVPAHIAAGIPGEPAEERQGNPRQRLGVWQSVAACRRGRCGRRLPSARGLARSITRRIRYRRAALPMYCARHASTNSAGCGSDSRAPFSHRPTTPSLSSASAAIHPLISTMGIPGPGCAAPPAR